MVNKEVLIDCLRQSFSLMRQIFSMDTQGIFRRKRHFACGCWLNESYGATEIYIL